MPFWVSLEVDLFSVWFDRRLFSASSFSVGIEMLTCQTLPIYKCMFVYYYKYIIFI